MVGARSLLFFVVAAAAVPMAARAEPDAEVPVVALGLRYKPGDRSLGQLGPFAKQVGAAPYWEWEDHGYTWDDPEDRRPFHVQFAETMAKVKSRGGVIHFDLTNFRLDRPGGTYRPIVKEVTAWELQEVLADPELSARTIFYLNGKRLTPRQAAEVRRKMGPDPRIKSLTQGAARARTRSTAARGQGKRAARPRARPAKKIK